MKTKLFTLLSLLFLIGLVGCINKNKNVDAPVKDFVPAANQYVCVKEIGIPTPDATAAKTVINEMMNFTQHQDYSKVKTYFSAQLQQKLEAKKVKDYKFDVFLPNASTILKSIKSYELQSMFLVQTNPKSSEISGFCNLGKELQAGDIYFHIQKPAEEEIAAIIKGTRGLTAANITLLLKKVSDKWKVDYINVYPSGAAGKGTFEIYQIADQFKKEGKTNLASLFYKLIEEMTPNEPVMPAYTAMAISNLNSLKTSIPKKKKGHYASWEVEPDYIIDVYDMKIVPFKEQLVVFVGYFTDTEEIEENNIEAELIKAYIIKNYPDIAGYFEMLITEGTFEFPDFPGYESVKRIQSLNDRANQIDNNAP